MNVIPELQPVAEFSYENYDSGAEFYGVFQELLEWERTAPTVERED